jgi:carbonyl reductase 1
MENFTADLEARRGETEGWPIIGYAYYVSKAGEIATTKAAAVESAKSNREVLISAYCPGFVNMDMTRGYGTMTIDKF